MQIEVKTRMRIPKKLEKDPEVILDLLLKPRGSGNRNKARRLADAFRSHHVLAPHILKVVSGTSRVTVHLRPSLAAMRAFDQIKAEAEARKDVEGQLPLFGLAG